MQYFTQTRTRTYLLPMTSQQSELILSLIKFSFSHWKEEEGLLELLLRTLTFINKPLN